MHPNGFHAARLCSQQKVERVSLQHTANGHKAQPETNPSLGALASFPDFSVTLILSATSLFFSCHFLLLVAPPQSCFMSVFSFSDMWKHDLVELVLEVPVSQVSHRKRDMLLRQVGVLLGVLDSDIIVREISALNEHR